MQRLAGSAALVTGGASGLGKAIAIRLKAEGARVTISDIQVDLGRDAASQHDLTFHTQDVCSEAGWSETINAIDSQFGRLDLLVNNVTAIPDELVLPGGFWEKPLAMQAILDVGLRSHYVASWHAARAMVPQREGLIVMVSSPGARSYLHGPAYGAGKAGIDKMSADMAVDLKKHQVAAISLWAALTLTERSQVVMKAHPGEYDAVMANAVHPEFMGRLLDVLMRDARLSERSGKTFYAAELAAELGVQDVDGRQPPSDRAFLGEPAQVTGAVIGG